MREVEIYKTFISGGRIILVRAHWKSLAPAVYALVMFFYCRAQWHIRPSIMGSMIPKPNNLPSRGQLD